jgi:acyl carrier protein
MDRETLLRTLCELLEEEMGETYEGVEESTDLRKELNLDSVDVVGLVLQVQKRFQIRLETEELEKVESVGDLLDLIQGKLTRPAQAA